MSSEFNQIWQRTFDDAASTSKPALPTAERPRMEPEPVAPAPIPPAPAPMATPASARDRYSELEQFEAWRKQREQATAYPPADYVAPRSYDQGYERDYPTRRMPEPLKGKKTYMGALVWIGAGVLSMAGVDVPGWTLDTGESLRMIWEGTMFIFTRMGISKLPTK